MGERWHGSRRGYEREGCRCAECRAANAEHVRAVRARRAARMALSTDDEGHGTRGGYDAGCRCEACTLTRQMAYWRSEGGPREHRWRVWVVGVYRDARDAWEALRESASYCQHETWEFLIAHPPPTLRMFLVNLSSQA